MIAQYIIVALIFIVAASWLAIKAIRSFTEKKSGCNKDCGCAPVVKK